MLTFKTSRRGFLQLSATGSAMLALGGGAASLSGCSQQPAAEGYRHLRHADVAFFSALAPIILAGSYPGSLGEQAERMVLLSLDEKINSLHYYARQELMTLLNIMQVAALRVMVGAPWADWPNAQPEDIEAFLEHWRNSRLNLKRMGYGSLCKLMCMSWYVLPENFHSTGYPGMPKKQG